MVVVDDSAILKVFRRIRAGANPDAELPRRLWDVGFQQTPEPIAEWRRGDDDLAVLVSGLGATPVMELYILYRRVHQGLTAVEGLDAHGRAVTIRTRT